MSGTGRPARRRRRSWRWRRAGRAKASRSSAGAAAPDRHTSALWWKASRRRRRSSGRKWREGGSMVESGGLGVRRAGSSLGGWIRERRKQRRMSQKDLAAYAKISRSYLCDIEQGRGTQPSLHVLQAIARSLGEDPAELMM